MNIKIKDMIDLEKPRERLMNFGKESLSNEELIAIVLRNGSKGYSSKDLATLILKEYESMSNLKNISINNLIKINGIGKVKAIELIASLELGKRVYYKVDKEPIILNNTSKIFNYFKDLYDGILQECFYAIYLDSKSKLISYKLLFMGTLDNASVHPREIFKHAFLESASFIVVMHNHPSGNSTPSNKDDEITSHLFDIGNIMGIKVVDHIIFGNNEFYSYYENMNK